MKVENCWFEKDNPDEVIIISRQEEPMDQFENDIISLMQDVLDFTDENEFLPIEMLEELAFYLDSYLTDESLDETIIL